MGLNRENGARRTYQFQLPLREVRSVLGLSLAFIVHEPQASQLPINERQQLIRGGGVALLSRFNDARGVAQARQISEVPVGDNPDFPRARTGASCHRQRALGFHGASAPELIRRNKPLARLEQTKARKVHADRIIT